MYFRQQPQLPSTTVLQVTGHLTIHHPLHPIQQRQQHQNQQSLINSSQHTFKDTRNNRKYDWDQQCGLKKKRKQTQLKDAKLEKSMEINGGKGYKSPYHKQEQNCQNEHERVSVLMAIRQIGSRVEKMEEAWENNNGTLNFETLYKLKEIRAHLQLQTTSLLYQLNQQIQPLRRDNQKWKKELEMQRSLLTKERQEWKKEKEQLYKQMEAMIETVLEEEIKQAKRMTEKKLTQLDEHLGKDLKTGQADLRGQVEKVEERLNLRVNKQINKNEELQEELKILSQKLDNLPDEVALLLVKEKEEMRRREEKERMKKIVDRTTPYGANVQVQHKTITLHKELYNEEGILKPQVVWLDVVVGRMFTLLVRLAPIKRGEIILGVGDRAVKHKRMLTQSRIISYAGIGLLTEGYLDEFGRPSYKLRETNDWLSEGMVVEMKVDRWNCIVTFTLKGPSAALINDEWIPIGGTRVYQAITSILCQPARQFAPFFVFFNKGGSVSYDIIQNS